MKTIKDIASLAGVSPATVSKAFNGHKSISEKTREMIFRMAEELDYFPNHSASQLARGKRETIGVVLSMMESRDIHAEYLIGIINGIFSKAESLSYRMLMFTPRTVERNNQNYVQFCRSNNLTGLIIHGLDRDDPQLEKLLISEVPCVFIDIDIAGTKTTNISVDNIMACREVVGILAGLSHKEIAFISGGEHSSVAVDRVKGYEAGMREHELEPHVIPCDFSKDIAYAKAKDYLLYHPETTAFFCASDLMAAGVMDACTDLGYNIPDDISVVGFDDLSLSQYLKPKLSTVAQDFFEMGSHAVDLLVDITNDNIVQPHNYVPYKIQMRSSTSRRKQA